MGLSGDVRMGRLRLSGDAAVVYSQLSGTDAHWQRIGSDPGDFTGPVPEDGNGWGYQLEATLDYRLTPALVVGAGLRYWNMQTRGHTHFEGHVVGGGASAQVVDWRTTQWGATAHLAWRF